jgi:hypothetical protein
MIQSIKCGKATLSACSLGDADGGAERDTGQRLSRELLGHQSKVNETLGHLVQQALAGLRSILPPAQSLE